MDPETKTLHWGLPGVKMQGVGVQGFRVRDEALLNTALGFWMSDSGPLLT